MCVNVYIMGVKNRGNEDDRSGDVETRGSFWSSVGLVGYSHHLCLWLCVREITLLLVLLYLPPIHIEKGMPSMLVLKAGFLAKK